MTLPSALTQLLDNARQAVADDEEGGLRLGLRQQIWREPGPVEQKRGRSTFRGGLPTAPA